MVESSDFKGDNDNDGVGNEEDYDNENSEADNQEGDEKEEDLIKMQIFQKLA